MSQWSKLLTKADLEARYALTAKLDPYFAAHERQFWEGADEIELAIQAAGARQANDADTYQMARSYAALLRAERVPA